MQGVIILALKKPAYSLGSFNLAFSIKHFNPSINITLVSDGEHKRHYRPEHYEPFDSIKDINLCDYIDSDGSFQPALAKLNIYKYSSYKRTLYIDADSLCFQDLQPLFDKLKGNAFKANVIYGYTQWTSKEMFNSFFGLDFGVTINSSWFYFENNKVFEQANKFYSKGFKVDDVKPKWGSTLPDELFFNAAIQKTKTDCKVNFDVMFFGAAIDKRNLTEIQKDYFAMTLYGGMRTVRDIYITFYDNIMHNICRSNGIEHRFKAHNILTGKHVLNK